MQSRLIVRNFGPIRYVDLDLRNVNVFIGPQASGKSALAKLFTIFKAPRKFLKNGNAERNLKAFREVLEEYNIASFLKPDSEIEFDSELHSLSYQRDTINYDPKLLRKIQYLEKLNEDFESNRGMIIDELGLLFSKYTMFKSEVDGFLFRREVDIIVHDDKYEIINKENILAVIEIIMRIELHLSSNAAIYVPSERIFSNIIKSSALNLLINNVPIPKHILLFGAELEKIRIKAINLDFLQENLLYNNTNGEERIFIDKENSIILAEAASGIQSVIPLLIAIWSRIHIPYHKSFVIEEPELNLFPTAQYELVKLLESMRSSFSGEDMGTIHTYTTHSPYILSALNNLLYASKIKQKWLAVYEKKNESEDYENEYYVESDKVSTLIKGIVKTELAVDFFTAYQINNGSAESIVDRDTGLIVDNYIDEASDKMADDFDALMNLMK